MIVKLPGSFTLHDMAGVSTSLKSALSVESPCVVLDFSDVHEMDTAAMDLLLNCASELIRRDGTLKIAALSPQAATLLELTGMNRILDGMPGSSETAPAFQEAVRAQAVPVGNVAVAEEPTLQTSAA